MRGAPQQFAAARVHEMHRALVAGGEEIARDAEAEFHRILGRADDGDAGGVEEGLERYVHVAISPSGLGAARARRGEIKGAVR